MQTNAPTFWANIYCGLRLGYDGDVRNISSVMNTCREFTDGVGLCVMVTPTTFVYTNGEEPGVIVGLINYPRFPSSPQILRERALRLADRLRLVLGQIRVSVMFPDRTVMIGEAE